MAVNVMIREWKALLYDPRMMLLTFGAPFLFWFFLPGFNGGAFPAVLVAYVLLGLFNSRSDARVIRAGLTQFPVTAKDHVAGLFLYQAVAVLFTGAVAVAFMQLMGPERFMADVLPKALGVGLLLTGILTVLGLWLPPQAARLTSILLIVLFMNFAIFQDVSQTVFMPWLSVPATLLLSAGGWGLFLLLGLRFPPQV